MQVSTKRVAPADESPSSAKRVKTTTTSSRTDQPSSTDQPYLLFVGSANGGISGETSEGIVIGKNEKKSPRHHFTTRHNIDFHGPVKSLEGRKFTGGSGPVAKRVVGLNVAIATAQSNSKNGKIFLATSSFGGRATAHSLSGTYFQGASKRVEVASKHLLGEGPLWAKDHSHLELSHPNFCKPPDLMNIYGVIMFGFPIVHSGQDRTDDLLDMPVGTRVLFVTGSKDAQHAQKLTNDVLPRLRCSATARIHVVVGGKHNPFDGCEPDEREKLVNVIQTFMDDCIAASQ